jgi:ArsR family transcriptional regulator, arsenate/arsenite/antimonite-responsive transcriptional repressor / arsenate reductase (thioredoxin)
MTPAYNVMFLSTRNSARSIMAEAILRRIGGAPFGAYSAGSDPIAAPHPEVMEKLRALGHETENLRSKSWHEFTGPNAPRMDFVLTLCDTLDGQICPDFGNLAMTGAWSLPDPVKFTGSSIERASMLSMLYWSLWRRIEIFLSLPFATLDRIALKTRLDHIEKFAALPVATLDRIAIKAPLDQRAGGGYDPASKKIPTQSGLTD